MVAGVKANKDFFGWIIATSTTVLWECMGIATGWYANSFHSEGIRPLSLLVILQAYIDYYQLLHDLFGSALLLTTKA
jgi:hypothetical protein